MSLRGERAMETPPAPAGQLLAVAGRLRAPILPRPHWPAAHQAGKVEHYEVEGLARSC
jgi:hypothetical protein